MRVFLKSGLCATQLYPRSHALSYEFVEYLEPNILKHVKTEGHIHSISLRLRQTFANPDKHFIWKSWQTLYLKILTNTLIAILRNTFLANPNKHFNCKSWRKRYQILYVGLKEYGVRMVASVAFTWFSSQYNCYFSEFSFSSTYLKFATASTAKGIAPWMISWKRWVKLVVMYWSGVK